MGLHPKVIFLFLFFLSGPLRPRPRAKVHKQVFLRSGPMKTQISQTDLTLPLIDNNPAGSDHGVPGRCGRQDDCCHKCPVMQQDHKQYLSLAFFLFLQPQPQRANQLAAPGQHHSSLKAQRLALTLPPTPPPGSPLMYTSPPMSTPNQSSQRGPGHLSCINSDLFMSECSVGADRPDRCIPATAVPS